jgi:GrpB-like predicted nucleotidyltransferase (UPF0157 family)
MILAADAQFRVEHVGSTAVPGCWGKGVVDLILLYPVSRLAEAREILDGLGFQQQSGPESFPETRPLGVGSVEYLGREYRVHVHVLEDGCAEASDVIKFRDLLRSNVGLRRAYEMQKRVLLSRGISESTQYSQAKREFIHTALARRCSRRTAPTELDLLRVAPWSSTLSTCAVFTRCFENRASYAYN